MGPLGIGRTKVAPVAVLLAALGALSIVHAQSAPYRSGIDLVPLDVCVTDRAGRYLPALTRDDFAVFENQVPQDLTFFSAEGELPLATVVLIDRSSSMNGDRIQRAKSAANAFLRTLSESDQAAVLAFNDSTSRLLSFGMPLSDEETLVDAVHAGGQTALWDAVFVGLRELAMRRSTNAKPTREAIILLSDGEDSASRNDFEELHREVQKTGTIVYSISIRVDARGKSLPPLHDLAQLANDSGGRVVALDDWTTLDTVYADIGNELRHMYRLAYVPRVSANDGQWRSLSVRVINRDARVRTRAGYFAKRSTPRVSH